MSHVGLVNCLNDISLSSANQSQAKFKSAVGGNLLQSWVNLTIASLHDADAKELKVYFCSKFTQTLSDKTNLTPDMMFELELKRICL